MAITKLFLNGNKPNIVIIITDQQRALQHYEDCKDDFINQIPALKWLMDNGLSFDRAFTASCACAPSRATFLTSQYPAKHKTTNTGQMEPKRPLNTKLPNLAHVLKEAGYETRAWLGKWHLGEIHTDPIAAGFTEWNAPDAGITISDYNTLGGGSPDNDGRYLADILKFIDEHRDDPEPFCLVASFVNPHDGFVAVRGLGGSGYDSTVFTKTPVPMPKNGNSPLTYKPRAQASASWAALSAQTDPTKQPKHKPQDYVNFYAYLQTLVDKQIDQILLHMGRKSETNEQNSELIDNTLIGSCVLSVLN
ncbi:MAG: sulfatase-like hydrolase/transferase [Gloeotrichia echinulata IR180]